MLATRSWPVRRDLVYIELHGFSEPTLQHQVQVPGAELRDERAVRLWVRAHGERHGLCAAEDADRDRRELSGGEHEDPSAGRASTVHAKSAWEDSVQAEDSEEEDHLLLVGALIVN